MDREKIIKGIDICLQRFRCGEDCPYYNDAKSGCMEQLREDALLLFETQNKLIRELQNIINAGVKMMEKGGAPLK